jgi:photosystem II stability/assembly factor-like uncharacterized protein
VDDKLRSIRMIIITTIRILTLLLALNGTGYAQNFDTSPDKVSYLASIISSTKLSESRIGFSALQSLGGNKIWAAGKNKNLDGMYQKGVVLLSSDAGFTWKEKLVVPNELFNDVFFVNSTLGWVVGSGQSSNEGAIFKTIDGGETWTRQKSPVRSMFLKIQFVNERKGWILGYLGDLLYTNDGGVTWNTYKFHQVTFENNQFYGRVRTFQFCDELNGWVVGEQGKIYKSTDGGVSWQDQFSEIDKLFKNQQGVIIDFYNVKFLTSQLGFVIAQISSKKNLSKMRNMTYLKTENGGKSWTIVNSISDSWLTKSHILSEKEAWVQIHSRELLQTIDGGKTWREILLPNDPSVPSNALLYFVSGNIWLVADSETFFSLALRSSDGGKTWEKCTLKYIEK